jgi:DNA primase
MDRGEIQRALDKISVESYLDREGVSYTPSYGTRGLQLNLDECPACGGGGRKTYVNAETGLGNCFHGSCGMKFNKWKLIKAVSGLAGGDLDQHIAAVAEDMGWLPKKERVELVRGDLELPSKCHALPVNGQNLQYLQDRGVSLASCERFHLSYCHGGWWGYKTLDGAERWVSFDKRVIIPIADLAGKLVSFQGRDVTGELEPKYLFPNGYAVAGSYIYNAHNFEDGRHTHLVIGEGAFDAIAIDQAVLGSPSCEAMLAGATFGMHLSGGPDGQIAKILELKARGLKTITMMWDSEKKAMALAVKMGLLLSGLGLTVRIAQLPDGFDPAQGPDKKSTPAALVRQSIFNATLLNRLSAIKLLNQAAALKS